MDMSNIIEVQRDLRFNPKILKKGKFVWEGYDCNRVLRYTGETKTYDEVRNFPKKGDVRTHNIDLEGNVIYVENNNSQTAIVYYKTKEDAKNAYLDIVGKEFESLIVDGK